MQKQKQHIDDEDPLVVKQTNDKALKALDKEMDIERMLEKEELQREKEQADELDYQVNLEKKKEDCIVKAIKQREIENQFNVRKKGKAEELNNLKEIAKKQITIRREYLKKRLENLRKRAEKKNSLRKQQIQTIRMEVVNKISTAYRKGSQDTCKNAINNNRQWEAFCNGFFVDDYMEMADCKKEKDRCHYCCEKEFGDLYIEERQKCVEKLCVANKEVPEGRWVWQKNTTPEWAGNGLRR